jgi:hypothetical protein
MTPAQLAKSRRGEMDRASRRRRQRLQGVQLSLLEIPSPSLAYETRDGRRLCDTHLNAARADGLEQPLTGRSFPVGECAVCKEGIWL